MIHKEAWYRESLDEELGENNLEVLRLQALRAVEVASSAVDQLMDAVERSGRLPKAPTKRRKFHRASGGIGEARAGLEDLKALTEGF